MLKDDNIKLLMKLLAISGKSGHEAAVIDAIRNEALQAGLPEEHCQSDDAHLRAEFGETGNLIITLPGNCPGPRRLLMAHVDTVPLCVGCEPVIDGEWINSVSDKTALGGDDRAGATVLLSTLLRILREDLPHPPITFLWTVQEEIGLVGARYADANLLGNPKSCFNFDGTLPQGVIIGATGDEHLSITVHGIASHAGAFPENGVSAIVIASLAIAELQEAGWLGKIEKENGTGTSNLGFIQGGAATNVVTDYLEIRGEARSHDKAFRAEIVSAIQKAFEHAATQIQNANNECGHIEFEHHLKYEAFQLDESEPVVQAAIHAVKAANEEPVIRIVNGGLDANWMTKNGMPTVTLGCGQEAIHTTAEKLHLPSFLKACEIAGHLATVKS
ncbi:MAG: M20/M25/M40 family metallo-hydrolase [Planctomycetaceae bacterium]|nr:M20/M25/M40 family metallo-hydrolase [Planctomycetaceae bacterium]